MEKIKNIKVEIEIYHLDKNEVVLDVFYEIRILKRAVDNDMNIQDEDQEVDLQDSIESKIEEKLMNVDLIYIFLLLVHVYLNDGYFMKANFDLRKSITIWRAIKNYSMVGNK